MVMAEPFANDADVDADAVLFDRKRLGHLPCCDSLRVERQEGEHFDVMGLAAGYGGRVTVSLGSDRAKEMKPWDSTVVVEPGF